MVLVAIFECEGGGSDPMCCFEMNYTNKELNPYLHETVEGYGKEAIAYAIFLPCH